jgi:hypothetical protein
MDVHSQNNLIIFNNSHISKQTQNENIHEFFLLTITFFFLHFLGKNIIYKKLKYGITIFTKFLFAEIHTNFHFLVQKSVKENSHQKRTSGTKFTPIKLRDFSPQANYTYRATAACRRS